MFNPHSLETLDLDERGVLTSLLAAAAVDYANHYVVFADTGKKTRPVAYQVRFKNDRPPSSYVESTRLIHPWYLEVGVAVPHRDNPRMQFVFTPPMTTWYFQHRQLTEHDIRVLLGRALYQRFADQRENRPFVLAEVASTLRLTEDQVFVQAKVLQQLGYAKALPIAKAGNLDDPRPPEYSRDELLRLLHLTGKGHQWAAAGYPPETMGPNSHVTVTVDLHVDVKTTIQEVRRADVDKETRLKFEALMHQIEEELEKPDGHGSARPIKDALEVASNSATVLVPLVSFLANHIDKIRMLGF